ncbi:MAG: hypothetical protein ACI8P3_000010 [Saprospiraceae bacterium]|jgi:hypothetical protein
MKKFIQITGIAAIFLALLIPQSSYGQVKIGDIHKGGIVFQVDKSGQHGLICQKKDFEDTMEWQDAMTACKRLGGGWHLATKDELHLMYKNLYKKDLGNFSDEEDENGYWSSTEDGSDIAWGQLFGDYGLQGVEEKDSDARVRAVRAF